MIGGASAEGSAPIPPSRAIALGAVQGPTELLPVSSSAHLTLIPWLADWDWDRLDPELRKSFEVALHAGAAAALLLGQRRRDRRASCARFDRRKAAVLALSFLPPAALGLALRAARSSAHLGGPLPTALGLLAGAAAMALADRAPAAPRPRAGRRRPTGSRWASPRRPRWRPGVSRNGATLTAARWRGLHPRSTRTCSRAPSPCR